LNYGFKWNATGALLRPLLVNICSIDLIYSHAKLESCTLYNYADDNSISYKYIEYATDVCIQWLNLNQMGANPSKFHSIVLGNISTNEMTNFSFNVGNANIPLSDNVKLLGVNVDNKLNLNDLYREERLNS
jgi:hypothetical protein